VSVNTFKFVAKLVITTPEGDLPAQGVDQTAPSDSFNKLTIASDVIAPATSGDTLTIPADAVVLFAESTNACDLHLSGPGGAVDLPLGPAVASADAEPGDLPLVSIVCPLSTSSPSTAKPTSATLINRGDDPARCTLKVGSKA